MSLRNFMLLGVLETFLVLQLIDKAYSSETSYSYTFPLWIIGVIIGGIILIVVVIIIIIVSINKYNKDRARIAAKRMNTRPTQNQQQQPIIGSQPSVIQPYSTGYNNYPNPNWNSNTNTNLNPNPNPNLYPNPDPNLPTLPLPIKTNNEFMY